MVPYRVPAPGGKLPCRQSSDQGDRRPKRGRASLGLTIVEFRLTNADYGGVTRQAGAGHPSRNWYILRRGRRLPDAVGDFRGTYGRVSEWPKEAGCKPVGLSLRWFESNRAQSGRLQQFVRAVDYLQFVARHF